jgi:serine/threonine protein kinase
MSSPYKVLAVTLFSCIIMPAFPCDNINSPSDNNELDNNNLNEKITKISTLELLKHELKEYEKLPDIPNAPYIKPSDVTLCKLPSSHKDIFTSLNNKFHLFDEDFFNYDDSWQLQMPYLGIDLLKYLTEYFISPFNELFGTKIIGTNVMTVTDMKNLYSLLVTSDNSIYKTLESLNSQKIYHNDIKLNNILYNSKTNKMYLIDFGATKSFSANLSAYLNFSTEIDYEYSDEVTFLSKVLLYFLYVSLGNKYIFSHIKNLVNDLEQLNQIDLQHNKLYMPLPSEKYEPINIKKQFITPYLNKLTSAINSLSDSAENAYTLNPGDALLKTPFTNFKVPIAQQRKKATIHTMRGTETRSMMSEDVQGLRGGRKKTKKINNKRKKTRKNIKK